MKLLVNGREREVDAPPQTPLLSVLRNDLGLTGAKFGCGLGQCGACTVHLDGRAIRSCITPLGSVGDKPVVTIEGLGTPERPHAVQRAFIDEQAVQCGYCIPGQIMTAAALLATTPQPSDERIRGALAGNLCRCATYVRIVRAVKRAAETSA